MLIAISNNNNNKWAQLPIVYLTMLRFIHLQHTNCLPIKLVERCAKSCAKVAVSFNGLTNDNEFSVRIILIGIDTTRHDTIGQDLEMYRRDETRMRESELEDDDDENDEDG